MAQKRKVWISCAIFTDDILKSTEDLNPNSQEWHNTIVLSQYRQISFIKGEIEGFLNRHKEITMEGFYMSSGARYYIAFFIESEYDHFVDEFPKTMTRLRNRPNTNYRKIDLEEQYIELRTEAKKTEV